MLKMIPLLLLLADPILGLFAQDSLLYNIFPMKDGRITYEKIVDVDSTLKDQLYTRAKMWGLTFYASQKDALQLDDKDNGIIAYKGYFPVPFTVKSLGQKYTFDWNYWEVIKILVKDNKAKVIVSDLVLKDDQTTISIENYMNISADAYGKKFKKIRQEAELQALGNFKRADEHIQLTIASIGDYLTGKKKIETDF